VDRRVGPAGIARHPFYTRLNAVLEAHGFDRFAEDQCRAFYAKVDGAAEFAAGPVFRLLLVGNAASAHELERSGLEFRLSLITPPRKG
jgi:hypothetical protein